MQSARIVLSRSSRKQIDKDLKAAERKGDLRWCKRLMAILLLAESNDPGLVARSLVVTVQSVYMWRNVFLVQGIKGLISKKIPGRKPKLTKSQRRELEEIIEKGPSEAGFPGNCWRSPMIQHLIHQRFGVFYSVHYISELLRNMGFSFQKARFVSDHLNEEARWQWLTETWPEIIEKAKQHRAYILFGDEVSFPQWGSLGYTWARKGKQPTIKTCGKRKGYKVFGLIDYFSGRFFYKCQQERFTSDSYARFLKEVLAGTRKHIILIQDGAKYHTSAAMREFFNKHQQRMSVYTLPSYSPDYNPIEKLWRKIKEKGTHLQYFPTFDDLINKVDEVLALIQDASNEVLSLFGFYRKVAEMS